MLSIENIIEEMLTKYTQGEYYDELVKAKEIYIGLTGKLNDDDEEYEARMNLFNDWYLFNYRRTDGRRFVDDYAAHNDFNNDKEFANSILQVNYSLFHFKKTNFRKEIVLKDILHSEKVVLSKNNRFLGLVEDDLFVGRVFNYVERGYFLKGVCTLPKNVLSNLKKESRKVRKLASQEEEEKFLLKLENLKVRSKNYGHVDANKIFVFS